MIVALLMIEDNLSVRELVQLVPDGSHAAAWSGWMKVQDFDTERGSHPESVVRFMQQKSNKRLGEDGG